MRVAYCPTHAQILDAAREEMAQNQKFMKDSVLRKTGLRLGTWTNHVQWPFIRASIEEELGGEVLQPVSDSNGRWDPTIHPEKFLPGAHHPTAGYARVTSLAPEVAKKYLQRRYSMAAGGWQGFERIALSYQQQGIITGYTPVALPAPQM